MFLRIARGSSKPLKTLVLPFRLSLRATVFTHLFETVLHECDLTN